MTTQTSTSSAGAGVAGAGTSTILDVDTVTKTYGEGHTAVTAVHEASMQVSKGEFVSLLGPSGSGKTTLISMIGGLLTPTSGVIRVGDVTVSDLESKELTSFRAQKVGFVFQAANLVPFLTARENLTWVAGLGKKHGRAARKAANNRADELLEELGLTKRAGNVPEKLSGGERQRVAIGRALMNDPDLVLVDEPTASLDTEMGRQVVKLLRREIKDRGKTGIMVTHDLRMVEYTDRVFEITDGFLDVGGDPAEHASRGH